MRGVPLTGARKFWEGRARTPVSPIRIARARLSRVVEAGGYAVHGGSDGVVESRDQRGIEGRFGSAGALTAQQVHLNQAERIDIRVAQTHGTEEDRIRFK